MSGGQRRRALLYCAALFGLTTILSACTVVPGLASRPAAPSGGGEMPLAPTEISLNLQVAHGPLQFPPAVLTCSAGGSRVAITGKFGVDRVQVQLTGLRSGERLDLSPADTGTTTKVTLTVRGPFFPRSYTAGSQHGPPIGTGTISVAEGAQGGKMDLQLESPGNETAAIRGSWNCLQPSTGTAVVAPLPAVFPAQVPPITGECAVPLQHLAGGDVGPITCSDGAVNVLAWNYLSQYAPAVQALGPAATLPQIERGFCPPELASAPAPQTAEAIYQISSIYFGWQFSQGAAQVLSPTDCPGS